jgi:D-glycero-D-manno-heptose 1,7-bisphosphate phosphatase
MIKPHEVIKPRRRFVLLDRDGTLIVERHYLSDPELVELLPNAAEGLRRMQHLGFGLVVVTNQSGIGRGYFDEDRLTQIHDRMHAVLRAEGLTLDGVYYCPHTPEDDCACRKPRPGLIEQAANDLYFEPAECVVIGDKASDIRLGQRVGATTILVRTGYGEQELDKLVSPPDAVVADLLKAASFIEHHLPCQ